MPDRFDLRGKVAVVTGGAGHSPPEVYGLPACSRWTSEAARLLIQVIVGTTRQGRFSDRVARWVFGDLRAQQGMDIELVDLRDYALPLFDAPSSPARSPRAYQTDEVARFGRVVDRADGYVVLTGEYNHGYPAVLKNAMDHTFVEWRRKPIAFVAWGNVGGARAVEQLRQVAVEFEMAPLRHAVHILPDVFLAARQASDQEIASAFAPLKPRLDLLVADLVWWATALTDARDREAGD